MKANWSRYSGVHSAVAPQSMSTARRLGGGHHRRHGRPADAPDPLDHQGGRREQGPRADPAETKASPFPVLEQVQAHGEGGVLLFLEGGGGVVLHVDDLAGRDNLHALGRGLVAQLGQAGGDVLRPAGEEDLHPQVLLGTKGPLNGGLGGIIAAHGGAP